MSSTTTTTATTKKSRRVHRHNKRRRAIGLIQDREAERKLIIMERISAGEWVRVPELAKVVSTTQGIKVRFYDEDTFLPKEERKTFKRENVTRIKDQFSVRTPEKVLTTILQKWVVTKTKRLAMQTFYDTTYANSIKSMVRYLPPEGDLSKKWAALATTLGEHMDDDNNDQCRLYFNGQL